MVSVLDHTEEQRVVLFISNLQPHLKQYLMTQRPKRMHEAIELEKLQEAATKCTNDAWPAQISKLQTLLEEQEAKINRVMNKAEEKIFAVLDEKEINAIRSNTYLDSYPARFGQRNQEKPNNTETYKQEPKQEQNNHRTPYAKDLEKEVAELRRQLTRNRRLNDPNA